MLTSVAGLQISESEFQAAGVLTQKAFADRQPRYSSQVHIRRSQRPCRIVIAKQRRLVPRDDTYRYSRTGTPGISPWALYARPDKSIDVPRGGARQAFGRCVTLYGGITCARALTPGHDLPDIYDRSIKFAHLARTCDRPRHLWTATVSFTRRLSITVLDQTDARTFCAVQFRAPQIANKNSKRLTLSTM